MTLNELSQEVIEINANNGWEVPNPEDWDKEHRIPTLLALIHSEVSEALEAFRANDWDNFIEEIADVQIRLLDLCGVGIDLDKAVRDKLEINKTRGYRHGNKRV